MTKLENGYDLAALGHAAPEEKLKAQLDYLGQQNTVLEHLINEFNAGPKGVPSDEATTPSK
jgi:hypothetical protein